ncbi:MAG: M81 family metallopeptidase [Minwuia sp.]|uniref:M81 family metallopeptidase n=1 Tax=Minwuia sp. TaxID=2493630 RepID=UPI003A8A1504
MKLFMACLATETNTFSPMPTGRATFEDGMVAHGDATSKRPGVFSAPLHEWRRLAEEAGWEVVEGLCAFAPPSGTTVGPLYEEYRDEILEGLKAAMPVDVVLFNLHGAMVADTCDDCEGDLLARAREIAGPDVVIGAELDLHFHLTQQMMDAADLLVSYKEYPHVDIPDRARDLFRLGARTAAEIRPVMRDFDCSMVNMYETPKEPMRGLVDRMLAREGEGGVLSLSIAHGFPWGDVERVGTRTLCIADGDAALAQKEAEALGRELFGLREELRIRYPDIETAIDRAEAASVGPVVLADTADNAGGGAPGDSTYVLEALIRRRITNVATGLYYDPMAVRACEEAGEGATLRLRVGGKMGEASGLPVDLTAEVVAIRKGLTMRFGEIPVPLGTAVWLYSAGIDLLLNTVRTQVFHPEAFEQMGIRLSERRIVVVKSSQHFYAGFAPIASEVIHMATPGTCTPDFAAIPVTKRDGAFWPRDEGVTL